MKSLLSGVILGIVILPLFPAKKLLFHDEFDTFNRSRWKHMITGWRSGNQEFQYYTDRRENSYVKNGILYIKPTMTADRFGQDFLSMGVLDLNEEGCNFNLDGGCLVTPTGSEIINPIQSARLHTKGSFSFTFGIIEIRAKMPKGDWLWPAFILLPTDEVYGYWPSSGTVTIAELRTNADFVCSGKPMGRQLATQTLHWGPTGTTAYYKTYWESIEDDPDFSSAFHTFRVEWRPDSITFSIDNKHVNSVAPPSPGGFWKLGDFENSGFLRNIWINGTNMAPFDKDFHIVISLAVGAINFYPDDCTNANYQKPWKEKDNDKMKKFWDNRRKWLPTWDSPTGEDHALQIDWIRVYSV